MSVESANESYGESMSFLRNERRPIAMMSRRGRVETPMALRNVENRGSLAWTRQTGSVKERRVRGV